MEKIYPMLKRRDDLVHMTQKPGQLFLDHYREVEKAAADCKLAEMPTGTWVGDLDLQNMAEKGLNPIFTGF